jgi:hypothetical protein
MGYSDAVTDNITFYKCDVSKWSEVEAIAKQVKEEASSRISRHCDGLMLPLDW